MKKPDSKKSGTKKKSSAKKKSGEQLDREIETALGQGAASSAERARSPEQAQYEARELFDAHRKLDALRRAPLADRKEAQAAFLDVMRSRPDKVAERLEWLLAGNYGYGPMQMAKRVLGSPRMNRSAALTQMVGAFEWQSPEDMSRAAWKRLSPDEQARLEKHVQSAIKSAESEE